MIEFFRDVLNGPLYIVTTILSVIFIMAIIGFLMERKKLEKEYKEQVAVVSNKQNIPPINQVAIEKEVVTNQIPVTVNSTINNIDSNNISEVNKTTNYF